MPFKTTVDSNRNMIAVVATTVFLFLICFAALKISVKAWVFIELIVLLSCTLCVFLASKNRRVIEYQNKQFQISNNISKQVFVFTLDEVEIVQTEKQEQSDCCTIKLINEPMIYFNDVNNYSGLLAAIEADLQADQ